MKSESATAFRIAVDMTPVTPGGGNGGAKVVALSLIAAMAKRAWDWQFILLTSDRNHDELACLDAANVHRACVDGATSTHSGGRRSRFHLARRIARQWVRLLPDPVAASSYWICHRLWPGPKRLLWANSPKADLLFYPFTAPLHYDPTVPSVSVIYDLQYQYYPSFFSGVERLCRDKSFRDAVKLATRLVCISEYVRRTVLENADLPASRVVSIPLGVAGRIHGCPPGVADRTLERLGLVHGEFLLYPANFWPHKNHRMLLVAFRTYVARHPESSIKLVCPGENTGTQGSIERAVVAMGLAERVILPGYVGSGELAALWDACRGLIYPSLYEGFGMPVVEAMAIGRPVLCSNATSLPEVAGDAAWYFDPRNPQEIVEAIEHLVRGGPEVAQRVERGRCRARVLGDVERMARDYLALFEEVLARPREARLRAS